MHEEVGADSAKDLEFMKILIAGDYCQIYRVDTAIREKRYGDVFDDVKDTIRGADYSIVNFEFPIVVNEETAKPIGKAGPHLKGTLESVSAIKYAGFNCCTLANNHILDQGVQCCLDTKSALEKSDVDTVGAGINEEDASKVLYKFINGEKIGIINCCEHEFSIASSYSAGANPLNIIRQYKTIHEAKGNANYVMVIIHGGPEHYQLPTPRMQEIYRFFIDAGADAIINHHQHCFSGYEIYGNKPIFYGLGNFCFDDLKERTGTWTQGYMVTLEFKNGETLIDKITPYTQCADSVGVYHLKEKNEFYKTLDNLNLKISSSDALRKAAEEYYNTCSKTIMDGYFPNRFRIWNLLHRLHLMPRCFNRQRYFQFLNFMECESHLDKQTYLLRKFLNI